MRIGILSDTHDQQKRTLTAVQMLKSEGAEILIHCGDLIDPDMVSTCASLPCYFAFGNNDSDRAPRIRAAINQTADGVCLGWSGEITLEGKRIAVTHGHFDKDVRRLLATNPDYLLSGHSHIARAWQEGTTKRINPGALHRARTFSVAVLDLANDNLRFLTVPR